MSKYLLVYQGQVDPSTQSAPTEASRCSAGRAGATRSARPDRLRRPHRAPHPRGRFRRRAADHGLHVVEAGSLDDARVLCDAHPFLEDAPADFSIDVYELMAM